MIIAMMEGTENLLLMLVGSWLQCAGYVVGAHGLLSSSGVWALECGA